MHPDSSGEPGAEREWGRALLDVPSTQSIPHLHTGSCAKPQGDLQPRGVKTVGGETMSVRLNFGHLLHGKGRQEQGGT